jgi:hypothetical protein
MKKILSIIFESFVILIWLGMSLVGAITSYFLISSIMMGKDLGTPTILKIDLPEFFIYTIPVLTIFVSISTFRNALNGIKNFNHPLKKSVPDWRVERDKWKKF